jgi:hypothetical protein
MHAHPFITAALIVGSIAAPLAVRAADPEPLSISVTRAKAPAEASAMPSILRALAARQQPDGGWSADGYEPASATAHAVICFLGEGCNPLSTHPHATVVASGLRRLVALLDGRGVASRAVATQALVSMALAEAAALSGDAGFLAAGRRACTALLAQRLGNGAWPAEHGAGDARADARATALALMALRSAGVAQLAKPTDQAASDAWFQTTWSRWNAAPGPARFPARVDGQAAVEAGAPQDLAAATVLAAFARPSDHEALTALGEAALAAQSLPDPESRWLLTLGLFLEHDPDRWASWRERMQAALDRDLVRTGPDAGCWLVDGRVDVVSTARLGLVQAMLLRKDGQGR